MSFDSGNELLRYDSSTLAGLVISASESAHTIAADALGLAGYAVRPPMALDATADLGAYDGLDLIVIEAAGAPEALIDIAFARANLLASERSLGVVASIAPDQIDLAAAHLLGTRTHILVEPAQFERVAAFSAAKGIARGRVQDAAREGESVRLQRLNEQVARIADTLAQLTRDEALKSRAVRDPGNGYRGPDGDGAIEVNPQEIRGVIRARRMRGQFFEDSLFGDPAWDMLLDLFAAGLERRQVSVSSLCIAAAVPPTTALRWIATMNESGLFERRADPSDRRRAYIGLSDKGAGGMRAYVTAVKRAGLPLV